MIKFVNHIAFFLGDRAIWYEIINQNKAENFKSKVYSVVFKYTKQNLTRNISEHKLKSCLVTKPSK